MTRSALTLAVKIGLFVTVATAALGSELPAARPEQVGLSAERLERIGQTLRADVDRGRIPGAVVIVVRRGKVAYFDAVGFRDKAANAPMTKDAIFRIASMTKPLVSVAALSLAEEGRLSLADPVAKYVPALGKMQVGIERTDSATGKVVVTSVPPSRPMTIQDLMRHTSGLTYGVMGTSEIHKTYPASPAPASQDLTMDEFIQHLGKALLLHHPGTTWEYGFSTEVLGHIIEVVSGKPLQAFLEERVYRPLGMVDTSFLVPAEKMGRLAQPFPTHPDSGRPITMLDPTKPRKFDCAGGCAVSTAMDYARFAQMLLNRGALEGARVLSRKTVEYMTADHLGTAVSRGSAFLAGPGYTMGLGVVVRQEHGISAIPGSAGDYHFWGSYGTHFWVDPKEELVVVSMLQSPLALHYIRVMRSLVLQSIGE